MNFDHDALVQIKHLHSTALVSCERFHDFEVQFTYVVVVTAVGLTST